MCKYLFWNTIWNSVYTHTMTQRNNTWKCDTNEQNRFLAMWGYNTGSNDKIVIYKHNKVNSFIQCQFLLFYQTVIISPFPNKMKRKKAKPAPSPPKKQQQQQKPEKKKKKRSRT